MQSIGLKEFMSYLKLNPEIRKTTEAVKKFEKGCELLKTHTRQYCRTQRKWLRNRFFLCRKTRQVC